MRSFVVLVLFAASLAQAGFRDYEETRELEMNAQGVDSLSIDAGAGSMAVKGIEDGNVIKVRAIIGVPNASDEKATRIIEQRMELALDKTGNSAQLTALFEDSAWGFGTDAYIALDVSVPKGLNVRIDDGAGSIDVIGVDGNVSIDDGSGSIEVASAADVVIDDGSGSIDVKDASGSVSIVDGAGSITVRGVGGGVSIDDGSGGIKVRDVDENLVILNDGAGGLSYHDVRGEVETET